MASRYGSSSRWYRVRDGVYESPDGRYEAHRLSTTRWCLYQRRVSMWRECCCLVYVSAYVTLADCQERAERSRVVA